MRARRLSRPIATIVALLVLALSPMAVVRATHDPQSGDIITLATGTWGMSCAGTSSQVLCDAYDIDGTWHTHAAITPGSGDLASLRTDAWVEITPLDSYFQGWMSSLQQAACAPDRITAGTVSNFVATVGALTSAGNVNPVTISAECYLTGGLVFVPNIAGAPQSDYWINALVIPPPTPTPSPTPTPTAKATPTPTTSPTPTSSPTATPTSSPTPSATPSPTPSPTPGTGTRSSAAFASSSETAEATETTRPSTPAASSGTPEQGIGGGTGTPSEPSAGSGLPAGDEGWTAEVPSPDKVSTKPIDLASSLALALLLMFAMAFPGELFNDTFQANYDEIAGWFGWKQKS
jgi:hypothetical protein